MQKTSRLAIVNNSTFEAAKVVNLHHYDISSALQTSLEFTELIAIFNSKIEVLIPHSAYTYINKEFDLEIKVGVFSKHSCSYKLKVEDQSLGELMFMRNSRFHDEEIKLLETLLCCLIYPLRNATLYQQARKMAYTDSLTQTYNRTAFHEFLLGEIGLASRYQKALTIIFLDVDHFKQINDDYGHSWGDYALTSVAKNIKSHLRSGDRVFRFGGEEFVVLLSNTNLDGAFHLAERIRETIASHVLVFDMSIVKMTASFGISILLDDDTPDSFVRRADSAMYTAKKNGRNQVAIG